MNIGTALRIIKILTNTDKTTSKRLSKECGISQRSVFRYMDELICSGIPINIQRGKNGGVSLDENYKMRNYNFVVTSRIGKGGVDV